jgi:ABC-type bacteriocin/lantibiotic exporter with double-glycine peptidase domain
MASYGMITAALQTLTDSIDDIAGISPLYDMVRPFLETETENFGKRRQVSRLQGKIEVNNVSFSYSPETPNVLEHLSLSIKKGEYVAIVGKTGCGKSTLFRLLLGFETPNSGRIYYDGKALDNLDLQSVRQNIGSVTQDGKLFLGDIYSNIVICKPTLTLDDAWKAAELAGIADDIRSMPMGMHTLISEDNGGISGGQRQRLMIARAIAHQPPILFFDEATSALDNISQKIVTDSLAGMNCTRLVIAHRLSTIRACDRILVLDKGKIVADGDYETLVRTSPVFAELVERQSL